MRKVLKKSQEEKNIIVHNLLEKYLEKAENWLSKHNDDYDYFDRYLSLFISVNIIYNLWAEIKNPEINFDNNEDKRMFLEVRKDVIGAFSQDYLSSCANELIKILDANNLYINVGEKNHKKDIKDVLHLKHSPAERAETIWESFYVIRCNLIHGEKGYDDRQRKLLEFVYPILESYLKEIVKRLKVLKTILFFIKKDCIIKSIGNKEYLITNINYKNITLLRLHAIDNERKCKINIEDLFNILSYFDGKENKINTLSIKDYVGGKQSPVIAILNKLKT